MNSAPSAHRSCPTLAKLLAPLSLNNFFNSVQKQKHYHALSSPARLETLPQFFAEDIAHYLWSLPADDKFVNVEAVKDGEGQMIYSDMSPSDILSFCARGYSLVLDNVGNRHASVAHFCTTLACEIGAMVWCNAYYTPAGQTAFTPHRDAEDVLILQMSGHKQWKLYDIPDYSPTPQMIQEGPLSEVPPTTELNLSTGDVLYIPNGMPHVASAEEESSWHLTIGIAYPTWADVLKECINQLQPQDERLRQPASDFMMGRSSQLLPDLNEILVQALPTQTQCAAIQFGMQKAFCSRLLQLPSQLGFAQNVDIPSITTWRRRADVPAFAAKQNDGRAALITPDKVKRIPRGSQSGQAPSVVALPGGLFDVLKSICDMPGNSTFESNSLEDRLDSKSIGILCKLLLEQGVIDFVQDPNELNFG